MRPGNRARTVAAVVLALALGALGISAAAPASADDGLLSFTSTPQPYLDDGPIIGSGLPADVAIRAFTPSADTYSIQWLLDGVAIDGATQRSYAPDDSEFAHQLSVAITGSRVGYTPTTVVSDAQPVQRFAQYADFQYTAEPRVGHLATASLGSTVPSDATVSYEWTSAGTDTVVSHTSSYMPVVADVGYPLSVKVTVSGTDYAEVYQNGYSLDVAPDVITPGPVSVYGAPVIGNTLDVEMDGLWSPDKISLGYQWQENGVDIPGATSETLKLASTDVGKKLAVKVTGSLATYDSVTVVSPPTIAVKSLFTHVPRPTITGTAKVGSTLTAHSAAWRPAASITYQWFSGATFDGNHYLGSGKTIVLSSGSLVGQHITVFATGESAQHGPETSTWSFASDAVKVGTLKPGTAGYTWYPGADELVQASVYDWPNRNDLTYQWNVDGVPVAWATNRSWHVPLDDLTKKISLTVSEVDPDPTPSTAAPTVSVTTKPKVLSHGQFEVGAPTVTGTVRVGSTLSANIGTWSPVPTSSKVEWHLGTSVFSKWDVIGKGSTFVVPAKDYGKTIFFWTYVSAPGVDSNMNASAFYRVGKGVFTTAPTATITGSPIVGTILAAHHDAADPSSGVTYSYQWFSQTDAGATPVAIPHATASSYKVAAAVRGDLVSVRVTANKQAYSSVAGTSPLTATVE